MSCAKMAEPIKFLFKIDSGGQMRKH